MLQNIKPKWRIIPSKVYNISVHKPFMFSKKQDCPKCKSSIKQEFDFCPHCGCDVRSPEKDMQDYGLLGQA